MMIAEYRNYVIYRLKNNLFIMEFFSDLYC
jgi:hypothetical protein